MEFNFSAFVNGLSTFLIGVTMVFVALLLLILLITLIGKIVASIENKNKITTAQEELVVDQKSVIQEAPIKMQDDLELVAAITAAIAASLGTTTDKLQVRSLRQVQRRNR